MKLSFIGRGEGVNPSLPGIALLNDEAGNTLAFATCRERFPELEITSCLIVSVCPHCGVSFVREFEGVGHSITGNPKEAWIFDPERPYNSQLAAEVVRRIEMLTCSTSKAMVMTVSDCVLISQRWKKPLTLEDFFE